LKENLDRSHYDNNYSHGPGRSSGGKHFGLGLLTGVLVALFLMGGIYVAVQFVNLAGAMRGNQQAGGEENNQSAATDQLLQKMGVVEEIIDRYFYREDVDKQAMMEGALEGMVASLGDIYSEYYTVEELSALISDIQGIYYGIGAYVSMDTTVGLAKISGTIEGAPAEEVDIRENDYIYAIDGNETYGKTLDEVVSEIKGPEGSKVTITLLRSGEYLDVEVERRLVEAPTVNYEMHDGGIAYIQITEFSEVTVDQFAAALTSAREDGMKGLILDLRSNPGGSLNAVVEIGKQILPKGLIVYTEDKNGKRLEYSSDGKKKLDVPLVVLINGNSASASEILAGAIKDYEMGTLLGTTTYGKGVVQQAISLSDGSAVKLTISTYYTPKGISIHGTGIEPDEECIFDGERYYSEEQYDNQLERAKELMSEMIAEN